MGLFKIVQSLPPVLMNSTLATLLLLLQRQVNQTLRKLMAVMKKKEAVAVMKKKEAVAVMKKKLMMGERKSRIRVG
jgi:hypothetical protein